MADTLKQLTFFTDTATDACWVYLLEIDGEERLKLRRRQKMFLARYARQSLFEWEDRDVNELKLYVDELKALLEDEGGPRDDVFSE